MSTMKIYIPTYKRVDKQITYNALPKKYKKKVIMVVQKQEEKLYKEKYDCKFEIVNNNIGLSKTRKHIFKISQGKRFCIIDDDVTFWRRNSKYVKEEQCGSLPDNELEPKMIKVKVKKDIVLFDQNKDLLDQENKVISVDAVNGPEIILGSMTDVSTSGNWPTIFDAKNKD